MVEDKQSYHIQSMMKLNKDISCTYCIRFFQVEQNYVDHLKNDHGIQKNIDSCLNIAKKKAGLPLTVKQEVIEEIVIDDDTDEKAITWMDICPT